MGRNSYQKKSPEIEAFPINYDELRITFSEGCEEIYKIVGFRGDYLVIEDGEIHIYKKENFEAEYEKKPYIIDAKPAKLKAFTSPPATVIYYGNSGYGRPYRKHRTRKAKFNNKDGSSAYSKE